MIDAIIDDLSDNALQYFKFEGKPVIEKLSEHIYNNSGIVILRVVLGAKETKLYVKKLAVSEYNRNLVHERVVTEFNIMESLHEKFEPYPKLSVARPVAVYPEDLILVTEECKGATLEHYLSRATMRWSSKNTASQCADYCRSSGQWLALFHEFTKKPNTAFNLEGLMEYCDIRLKLLAGNAKSHVDDGFRRRVIQYLERLANEIRVEDNFIAGRHNDFLPQHVFLNEEQLAVIDLTMFDYDSIYYDICSLWNKLESMKADPLVSSNSVSRSQEAFLDGYGRDIDLNTPLFKAILVRRKVTKMLEIANSQSRWLHHKYLERKLYWGNNTWLTSEIES